MSRRVLVVEDDSSTSDFVAKGLREEGFTVEQVADGRDGLHLASCSTFDVIVMDRMVPGLDGLSVVKALRAAAVQTPILILSSLSHLDERVRGLRAGGDDYLVKPFGFSELHVRLDNLMRRRSQAPAGTELVVGDLVMDLAVRRVTRAGKPVTLLPRQFKLLEYLLRNKGLVVTRAMMLEQVWDYRSNPDASLIDAHVSLLRKQIDAGADKPLLHTVRGAGYRLSEEP